nr:MAG TPA: hypothetical protein [Caudoviricetes sp.]
MSRLPRSSGSSLVSKSREFVLDAIKHLLHSLLKLLIQVHVSTRNTDNQASSDTNQEPGKQHLILLRNRRQLFHLHTGLQSRNTHRVSVFLPQERLSTQISFKIITCFLNLLSLLVPVDTQINNSLDNKGYGRANEAHQCRVHMLTPCYSLTVDKYSSLVL